MQFERNDGVRSEQLVHFRVLINLKKVKSYKTDGFEILLTLKIASEYWLLLLGCESYVVRGRCFRIKTR
jgi:hypothetical protein